MPLGTKHTGEDVHMLACICVNVRAWASVCVCVCVCTHTQWVLFDVEITHNESDYTCFGYNSIQALHPIMLSQQTSMVGD